MKSEGAIKHKLKQVRFRHLKKRVEAALKPTPGACAHNRLLAHPLTNGTQVGTCIHPDQEDGQNLCDTSWGGCPKAQSCKLFDPAQSKEEVKAEFREELSGMAFAEIAFRYPDMAALLWTLGEEQPEDEWDGMPDPDIVTTTVQGVEVHVPPEAAEALARVEEDTNAKLFDKDHEIGLLQAAVGATTRPDPVDPPRPQEPEPVALHQPWWRRLWGGLFG